MTAERGSWGSLFSSASRPIAIIIAVGIALHSANIYVASAVMPSVPKAGNSVASRARSDTANLTRAYRKISARSGTELAPRLPPT